MHDHTIGSPFATDGFLPHGFCYLWDRPLLLTHLISDILIGLSYVTISVSLAYLVHRARRDIPFSVLFIAFGLFIVACGATHFMEVWTIWQPVYWLAGMVKVVTAAASVSTAVAMPFMVPKIHATIRDAKLARERELTAARMAALEESKERLQRQADALREAEARLRDVLDSLTEPFVALDAECRYRFVNTAAAEMLSAVDLSPGELRGKRLLEVFPVLRDTPEHRAIDRAMRERVPVRLETFSEHVRKWIDLRAYPTHDGGVALAIMDISQRKQAEEALQESEQRFRVTFEQAAVGIAHVALDGHWLRVNRRLCEIVGYPREELLRITFQDITHPDDLEADLAQVARLLAGEISDYSMEKRYVRKDGSVAWTNLTATCLRDETGRPQYFISVVEDISVRKQTEQALCESEARKGAILASTLDCVISMDHEGRITEFNPAAEQTFGYTRADALGQELAQLIIPPTLRDRHRRGLARYLATGEGSVFSRRIEMPALRADGTEFPVELTVTRVPFEEPPLFTGFVRDITERKRAEEALRRSEARLSGIIASAMDAIISVDEEQRIVVFNAAAEAMFGCRADEAIGQPLERFIPERFREAHAEHIGAFGRTGVTSRTMWTPGTLVGLRADGEEFPIEASISQVESGGQKFYTAIVRDITERKRTEEALHESEERLRLLAENVLEVLYITDPAAPRVLYVSPAYREVWGRTPESLYQNIGSLIGSVHPEDRARVGGTLARQLRGEETEIEYRIIRADGLIRHVRDRAFPVRNDRGEVYRVVGVAEDVTERKRAEDAQRLLAEASALLAQSLEYEVTLGSVARLLVPSLADWCSIHLLHDGEIRQVAVAHREPTRAVWLEELDRRYPPDPNQAWGVPAVVRTGLTELYPVVTDEMLVADVGDAERLAAMRQLGFHSFIAVPLTARGQILGAMRLVSADPRRRFDDVDLALAEELARRVGIAIDNARLYFEARDERKRAEAQAEALEQVNRELAAATRQAEEANKAKSDFLAVMSHELRTPLNAVVGYTELLELGVSGSITQGQQKQLSRIRANARHLVGIIDEILHFARIDAGKERVIVERVAVAEIAREAAALVEPLASAKGLALAVEVPDGETFFYSDPGKVRQILVNLLGNGVKFTNEGEVRLNTQLSGDRVSFEVRDTGIGIPEDKLARVFDPFWQAEQGKTRQSAGTGLGLSVVRQLATLLGGEARVSSTPGVGSTFTVVLPLVAPVSANRAA